MQSFKKDERLRHKKLIDRLFQEGKFFFEAPFKVLWMPCEEEISVPAQILISVSKRRIPKAVQRNLLKRRIREGFRKNKSLLYQHLEEYDFAVRFALVYSSGRVASYSIIEQKIILILQRLNKELREKQRI
ncbi:MAG: ribonuclease P protein component [Bacteroidales bacterium]|nr:ribonuclease P protein component [Bacteroidales bacterium]MCF8405295.1 ribonuclease P protein component [Bacteroidales bacterium]